VTNITEIKLPTLKRNGSFEIGILIHGFSEPVFLVPVQLATFIKAFTQLINLAILERLQ
jgi:hypothetical protein